NGVVHDKLYLPGLLKLRRLIDSGFFGEILSVRGEFGYWVYEGDWQSAQRPSWNYRSEDGGGIVADMFPHWNYVIEEPLRPHRGRLRPDRHPHRDALGRAGPGVHRHRR
ncbi:Gfo/Idh/MocA family protein, partial [Lonsdalea populi]|uniref:Gfo/Idh/MocA family protein n=1 Tax=Lonsdalea populi TaxID=1172565 RepID=UPI003F68A9C6